MKQVRQSFLYSAVSGICLVLGLALIPLLNAWGLHYALATTAAFALVCIIGFVLHSSWTFRAEKTWRSFIRYSSAMALNLPVAILLIAVGHDIAGLSVAISTAIASAVLFLWNFLALKFAVFLGPRSAPQ